jgi:hypothetical protein
MDDRALRRRADGLEPDAAPDLTRPHCPAKLVEVADLGHRPTALPGVFACREVVPGGTEAEGAAVSGAGDPARPLFVTVYGSAVPAVGSQMVARLVRGRWVAERGGRPTGHALAPCGCGAIPDVLYLVVPNPSLYGGAFQPDTITRQAAPAWAVAQGLATDVEGGVPYTRLGAATFTLTVIGLGVPPPTYQFRWWFGCSDVSGAPRFNLKRAFPPQTPPLPATFLAAQHSLYSWTPGFAGNTCSPFRMVTGQQLAFSPPTVNSDVQVRDGPA